jgi:hypothetical protein
VTTKLTLTHDDPAEPAALESGYPDQHPFAQQVPGVRIVVADGEEVRR